MEGGREVMFPQTGSLKDVLSSLCLTPPTAESPASTCRDELGQITQPRNK